MAWFTDSLRSAIAAVNPFGAAHRGQAAAASAIFSHQFALAAYRSSGMLRKVIRIPADDAVREWRDWQAEKEQIEAIEKEERRLNLIAKVKQADVLRGIGGGALILVTAGSHEAPLDPAIIREGGLIAVNVVTRWQITGLEWVRELADPAYGTPRMFQVNAGETGGATKIHPSRVVCFRGEPLPAGSTLGDEDAFWGDSRLLQVLREVETSDNAQGWFAELVKKAKLLRVGIPNIMDHLATADGKTKLASRVALIGEGESTLNATVYDAGDGSDKSGEKITDFTMNWAGIPAMMDAFDQRVAAVADIPFTRLMGRSPAGMNATGQHDTDNWNKSVAARQKLELRPCLEQFDEVLIRSAGVDPANVTWRFAPLDTPTEKEEADTFKTTMEAVEKLQGTGAIPDEAFAKGIQNLMSEREWVPGLDQALAEIPEAERFGLNPDPEEPDPSELQAKGGDPVSAGAAGGEEAPPARRAANDAKPRSLYVSRKVQNVGDLKAWARAQGLPSLDDDLHVTIAYSTTPVDWIAMGATWADFSGKGTGELVITAGGPRVIEPLGNRTAVLMFASSDLSYRNGEMREKGASWDFPDYQPHISLTGEPVDLSNVEPYRGKIVLGPEVFEEIEP